MDSDDQRGGVIERRSVMRSICTQLLMGIALVVASFTLGGSQPPTALQQLLADGQLRVLSRNGPTTYYESLHGRTGLEYHLLQGFAEELGVTLVIEDEDQLGRMLDRVSSREVHLAAAGLTVTESRQKKVRFSIPYQRVSEQVLYNSREPAPTSIEDLVGKELLVIANSSHVERLRQLQQEYPALTWREVPNLDMVDLMDKVHNGTVDHAIVDSNAYQLNHSIFPRTRVAFELGEPQPLAWAFPRHGDSSLYDLAQAYLARIQSDGTLAAIEQRLNDQIAEVSTGGALLFVHRVEHRLPLWEEELKTAAAEFELDWQLLAALAYQESHWDADARSRTGVRGLMMLTQRTARELGVSNRLDPSQSIHGGARYLRNLYDRLPAGVQGEDRTWMALAAYNIGMGHLEDARIITQRHGGDPNLWADVAEHLPKLAKQQYYRHTRYGYARGWEPVTYVRNIRNYYAIITWHEQQEQRRLVLVDNDEPVAQRKVSHNDLTASLSVL